MQLYPGAEVFRNAQRFIITSHQHPDGDAVGSAIGLGLALKGWGKEVAVVAAEPLSHLYHFLPGSDLVQTPQAFHRNYCECGVVLDCTSAERLSGEIREVLEGCTNLVNIDHHVSNTYFASINIVDVVAAATGEMLYQILTALGVGISPDVATNLYAALVTDTGYFRYQNTTPGCHLTASSLLKNGADYLNVHQCLNEQRTMASLHLLEKCLSTLKIDRDGLLAWMVVPKRFFLETETGIDDSDDFINYPKSIAGVEVGILFKEVDDQEIRVGFRSKRWLDVNALAALFGGGGHERAAGCTVRGTLAEAEQLVVETTRQLIEKKRCGSL